MPSHTWLRDTATDDPIDVAALGARTGLLWKNHDMTLAGIGEFERIPVTIPDGVAAATSRLAELGEAATFEGYEGPGSGVVAFGALPFTFGAPSHLIVPNLIVGADAFGRQWVTATSNRSRASADVVIEKALAYPVPYGEQPTTFDLQSVIAPEVWRDEIVAKARDRIKSGELNKAVLARELILRTDQPINTPLVLERLLHRFPTAIVFAVEGFIGASPELLVSRLDNVVRAHPLAGTAPRSASPDEDARLAADLRASTKDQSEHRITIDWFLNELLPFCSYVDAEPEPSIVTMANVHHLGTSVEGVLSSPPASVLELVAALHPTPAVGGDPQGTALAVIDELERADRGRYAGPTGWVDADGNGAFAVSVRSAQISLTEARLFAGVGVVADSDPEAELAETRAKFQAMLGALIQP